MSLRCLSALCATSCAAVAGAGGPSTGKIPLTELGTGTYLGFPGGLYPGGLNSPPAAHAADALTAASQVVPRSAGGAPDPEGFIGMISIGMSNTTHEFAVFERLADSDQTRNARVVMVNAAHGGQSANAINSPTHFYWDFVRQRVSGAGLTDAQVQVAWIKLADANPANDFPVHSQALRDELRTIVGILRSRFPNLAVAYLSSRIYGGYTTGLNPEPQAYEEAFAFKWLIEEQMSGAAALNWDPQRGAVVAPLLLWGPYLWADGVIPRADGVTWLVSDMETDHVHPSPAGELKVAQLLQSFLAGEPSAQGWWWRRPDLRLRRVEAIADSTISAASPTANFGQAQTLMAQGGAAPNSALVKFQRSAPLGQVVHAKVWLRVPTSGQGGAAVRSIDPSWTESAVTWANAPASGALLSTMPIVSRDGSSNGACTSAVEGDADGLVAFQLSSTAAAASTYASREVGESPALVVAERTRIGDIDFSGAVDGIDLGAVLGAWGKCPQPCGPDLNGDGAVDASDITVLLGNWG